VLSGEAATELNAGDVRGHDNRGRGQRVALTRGCKIREEGGGQGDGLLCGRITAIVANEKTRRGRRRNKRSPFSIAKGLCGCPAVNCYAFESSPQ
jgi:hypothetical protein